MRESTARTRFIAGAFNCKPTGVNGPTTPGSLPQRCPSSRATKAGKLAAPRYGQLSALGARSNRLARHEARASTGGICDGRPTKMMKMYKYNSKEEYEDAYHKKRNRARRERRRHAYKRLMAAKKNEETAKIQMRGSQKKWRVARKKKHNREVQRQKQRQRRHHERNRQIWARLQAIVATAKSTRDDVAAVSAGRQRKPRFIHWVRN